MRMNSGLTRNRSQPLRCEARIADFDIRSRRPLDLRFGEMDWPYPSLAHFRVPLEREPCAFVPPHEQWRERMLLIRKRFSSPRRSRREEDDRLATAEPSDQRSRTGRFELRRSDRLRQSKLSTAAE